MKLQRYFIVGRSLRDSVYCYNYMRDLLRNHIRFTNSQWRIIDIDEFRLIFTNEELYYRNYRHYRHYRHGNHDVEIISCYYVERLLDMYRTLARI